MFFDRSVQPIGTSGSPSGYGRPVVTEVQWATLMSIFAPRWPPRDPPSRYRFGSYSSLPQPAGVGFVPLTDVSADLIMLWRSGV